MHERRADSASFFVTSTKEHFVSRFLFISSCFALSIVACTDTDQQSGSTCGDGKCEAEETHDSCPEDCPAAVDAGPTCGNGKCETGETSETCPADCGSATPPPPPPACGNGVCDSNENYQTCPSDCETTVRVNNDSSYIITNLYAWPCNTTNGETNVLQSALDPDYYTTLTGEIGCWNLQALSSTEYWESDNNNLTTAGFTWTLNN